MSAPPYSVVTREIFPMEEVPPRLTPNVLQVLINDYEVMPDTEAFSIPGVIPLDIPTDVDYGELINYSNVFSDDTFDYRTVELPLDLVLFLPRRNFCEREWRHFGVCMSRGWENFDRRPCELHVLLFRRPKPHVSRKHLEVIWAAELAQEEKQRANSEFLSRLDKVFIFPMFAFIDVEANRAFHSPSQDVSHFHQAVLTYAHTRLSKRLSFQLSGG